MLSESTIAEALSPRILSLILLPTEKCNFRCTYCYEDFAIGRMQPSVVRGIKALITHRVPHLDRLNISWFGGGNHSWRGMLSWISVNTQTQCAHNTALRSAPALPPMATC